MLHRLNKFSSFPASATGNIIGGISVVVFLVIVVIEFVVVVVLGLLSSGTRRK